jgi:hypothetical protein
VDDHSGPLTKLKKKIPNGNIETVCGTVPLTKLSSRECFGETRNHISRFGDSVYK